MPRAPWLLPCLLLAGVALAAPQQVAFEASSPFADRREIAARLLHGVQHQRLLAHAASSGRELDGPALDARGERWQLFVPAACADAACGVLVWISPWDQAPPPRDWLAVLEAARIVYVAAESAGNARDVLDRRVPLALLGLAGVEATVRVDPRRRYVGGFSGGGRVASRIAAG